MRFDKDLDKILEDFKPDVTGITSYTVYVNIVKQLFEKIKLIDQKIFTVVGGHHATVAPDGVIAVNYERAGEVKTGRM